MPEIGSVSSGTMRPEDLIPCFASLLRNLDIADAHHELIMDANAIEDYGSDDAAEILSELFAVLNDYAPEDCYFGAHEGDGADYGFWRIPF